MIYKEFANENLWKSHFIKSSNMLMNCLHKGICGRDFLLIVVIVETFNENDYSGWNWWWKRPWNSLNETHSRIVSRETYLEWTSLFLDQDGNKIAHDNVKQNFWIKLERLHHKARQ